jgi:radical SAM superfamily enzyme YgiQ (UPF0313 family)
MCSKLFVRSSRQTTMADIVIINPRLEISLALVPEHHEVTLIDENVEDIDFARLARADFVCLTGMSIQGRRMREILERVRSFGVVTVVGGPLATVEEETLEGLADVVFVGEADETWPQFLREWEQGCQRIATSSGRRPM